MPGLIVLLLLTLFRLPAAKGFTQTPQPAVSPADRHSARINRGVWNGEGTLGRGIMGSVTEAAADHFTVRIESGELYTVRFSVNTRILRSEERPGRSQPEDGAPLAPPVAIRAGQIRTGDAIAASGELDSAAKSVGAVVIFLLDQRRAKELREIEASYGRTWLLGRVTAIHNLEVTLLGGPDNTLRTFVADENTLFRKRGDPIILAEIAIGDPVRVEGSMKKGAFLATSVTVMSPPAEGPAGTSTIPQ